MTRKQEAHAVLHTELPEGRSCLLSLNSQYLALKLVQCLLTAEP